MRTLRTLLVTALAGVLVATTAPAFITAQADEADDAPYPFDSFEPTPNDNAILQWNEEALECIRLTKPGPTIVSRALYILHTSTYDAWSGYDAKALPTMNAGWKRQPTAQRTTANASEAVSHAAHRALVNLFPAPPASAPVGTVNCEPLFNARLTSLGYTVGATTTPAVEGRRAAGAIISRAATDGSNQNGTDPLGTPGVRYSDTTGYVPVNTATTIVDIWRWQPVGTQRALTPQWGNVRSFVPTLKQDIIQVPDPRQLSESEKQKLVDEVVAYSAGLTDRQKAIAEYWADGPSSELPPGHCNLFAQWTSRRHGQSLAADAKMFFGLNAALHDAGIAAWHLKYRYDYARPISVVRELRRGQMIQAWAGPGKGTQLIRGEDWRPYQAVTFITPPFPAYVSGHSTFSAAAAAFFKDFGAVQGRDGTRFGASVTIPAGSSKFEANVPAQDVTLTWATYEDAANEAGISRQYGGIHWSIDDMPARDLGKKIGEAAFSRAKTYWEG